jgi:hypothetical protein
MPRNAGYSFDIKHAFGWHAPLFPPQHGRLVHAKRRGERFEA